MGRFNGDDSDWDERQSLFWEESVYNALHSKRGRAVLKELEAALVAMPEHKLAYQAIATPEGRTCALGELAVSRRVAGGESRGAVIADLALRFPATGEPVDAEYATYVLRSELGLTEALATRIAQNNDDDYCAQTDEQRWVWMLAWVRARLAEPALARKRA